MSAETPSAEEPIRIAAVPAGQITGEAHLPPDDAIAEAAAPAPPEVVAAAADGGSLGAKLRAKLAQIEKGTKEFDIPGWDGELVMVAQIVRDSKQIAQGMTNEQLIIAATQKIQARNDDGELEDLGGWEAVGAVMGMQGEYTLGQVVRAVLDNTLRLDAFAVVLTSWMAGRKSVIEQVLGE